jgi:hypothetical protein
MEFIANKGVWLIFVLLAISVGICFVISGALSSTEAKVFFSKPLAEATLGEICFILFIFGCLIGGK